MRFDSFILAADDWGLSPGVNAGILELSTQGILSSVSVMTTARFVESGWNSLRALRVSRGLHLNFTFESEFRSPGALLLSQLKSRFSTGRENQLKEKIRELTRIQLERFQELSDGNSPAHLDGHQHIHLMVWPWIEDLVIDAGVKRIRLPYDSTLWASAKAPINFWALRMKRSLQKHPTIQSPLFAYPPTSLFQNSQKLRAYLEAHHGYEILCHPAKIIDFNQYNIEDSLRNDRVIQYQALKALGTSHARD